MNLDVAAHRDEIEEECDFATKEYALENAKERMRRAWESMAMALQEYKSSGKFILVNSEEAFTLLDDHLIKTQAMLASPYVHRFWEKAMEAWRNKLKVAQQRLTVWMVHRPLLCFDFAVLWLGLAWLDFALLCCVSLLLTAHCSL